MSILFGDPVTPRDVVLSQRAKRFQNSNSNSNTSNVNRDLKELSIHDKVGSRGGGRGSEQYICALTQDDIVESGVNKDNETPASPGEVVFLQLCSKRLSDVSILDLCDRMTICDLSCNYLKNIAPLKWCVSLYYLDLHSNQITCLPDSEFWSSLKRLHVLYLHDNGIGKLEELRDLSHAPSLISLTLYDTPLSLKKNYRHCVVNALWTLKALDHCVVSDEEIIEDANFSATFKPLQPQFKFKATSLAAVEGDSMSLRKARSCVNKDVSTINKIQSKYCPVLIIQKLVRGYLIRLRYNYVMDTRLWAAVSIQRYYRGYKGIPNPPPSTPLLHYQDFMYQSMSNIKLDYEAYLKMRRQMDPGIISMKSVHFGEKDWSMRDDFNSKVLRKRISINLEMLMGKATEMKNTYSHHSAATTTKNPDNMSASQISSDLVTGHRESDISTTTHRKSEQLSYIAGEYAKDLGLNVLPSGTNRDNMKIGKYYTQFKFLGPMDPPSSTSEESHMDVAFRLSIDKPPVMKHDPLEELVLRTVEGADDIRRAIKIIDHDRQNYVPKKVGHREKKKTDKRGNKRGNTNMGFSCFRAIDKAYRDRSKLELVERRANTVKHLKEMEDLSLEQVRAHNFSSRNIAAMERKKDQLRLINALAHRKQKELEELDRIDAKRTAAREKQRRRHDNYKFAVEFNCQNASVGKALANHDRTNRRDEEAAIKADRVGELRGASEKKRELISGYLESAKVGRQMESMHMKRTLLAAIHNREAERADEQVNRVKGLRERKGSRMTGATLVPVKQFAGPEEDEEDVEYL